MRSLVEKWNKFLNEEEGAALPFRVYCDMDGVLVDLPRGIADQARLDLKKKPRLRDDIMIIIGQKEEWKKFVMARPEFKKGFDMIDNIISDREDFWANLPPMEGMTDLWSYISQFNPSILSLSSPIAVSIIMGVSENCFICSISSIPSPLGIILSIITRSNKKYCRISFADEKSSHK